MTQFYSSPFFGISLVFLAYSAGIYINIKCNRNPIVNPLIIATAMTVLVLVLFDIPMDSFMVGGEFINMMLVPVTAVLGLNIYNQRKILKEKFIPIVVGCLVGCITNVIVVLTLCKLFAIDSQLKSSLLPRSVTTPIAVVLSEQHGGFAVITMCAVLITGLTGALIAPILIKVFKINHPVAQGVAIGASSHALGTTKALEIGEIQGAMSGVSIGVSGLITVFMMMFF